MTTLADVRRAAVKVYGKRIEVSNQRICGVPSIRVLFAGGVMRRALVFEGHSHTDALRFAFEFFQSMERLPDDPGSAPECQTIRNSRKGT